MERPMSWYKERLDSLIAEAVFIYDAMDSNHHGETQLAYDAVGEAMSCLNRAHRMIEASVAQAYIAKTLKEEGWRQDEFIMDSAHQTLVFRKNGVRMELSAYDDK